MDERPTKESYVRIAALLWLLFMIFYGLGSVSATEQWWPQPQIREMSRFLAGHREEDTTLWQKLQNDIGGVPLRHAGHGAVKAYPRSKYHALRGLDLDPGRDAPIEYLGKNAHQGYRILYGSFHFKDFLHGAILLDPDGKVQKVWRITQEDVPWPHRTDATVFPHGFDITRDGSIVVVYEAGTSLTKYDYCGRKVWQVKGGFHHSVDLFDQESLWVWGNTDLERLYGENLIQIAVSDGSVLRKISLADVIAANPDIDILRIRQIDRVKESVWANDPFHPNDIDPLPADLARYYPDFRAGDLLVSLRSLNLVFVLDPRTLEVKWWRTGATRRQHDPDWNNRGTITVFNNNMHGKFSSIVEIDPRTMERHTLIDGADYDFYTRHRGKHRVFPDGAVMITSPDQGRVFEVAPDGAVTFDFHNRFNAKYRVLSLSEARFLPVDYFGELPKCES